MEPFAELPNTKFPNGRLGRGPSLMEGHKHQAAAGLLEFSFLSSRRRILPTLLFGSSDLNSTCFGTLYGVNCVPAKPIMSCAVRCGSTRTTNTLTASVDFASGIPIAAHSKTPGWLETISSTSFG